MATTASIQVPPTGTYRLVPTGSTVSFSMRHMFGLQKVSGTFDVTSGDITVADPLGDSTVEARVSTESFASGHPTRDEHVKADRFLHVDEHPEMVFRSTAVTRSADSWLLRGDLTVRDTTAPLEFTVTDSQVDGDDFTLQAVATVDRYDFGILNGKGFVGRRLHLTLHTVAKRAD